MDEAVPVKEVLFDLEGTLFFRGERIVGACEALESISALGYQRRFLTNSDSKTATMICSQLISIGLDIDPAEVFTPLNAVTTFLQQQKHNRCHLLMPRALSTELAPFVAIDEAVNFVVLGDVRESSSYKHLNQAFRYLRAGARLIALQKGRFFVGAEGECLDTGAFVQLLEYASGQEAIVMGKPYPYLFEAALTSLGVTASEALVVGDDPSTDLIGAQAIGARCVLVRTGKFTEADLARVNVQPTSLIDSVAELPDLLSAWGGSY